MDGEESWGGGLVEGAAAGGGEVRRGSEEDLLQYILWLAQLCSLLLY